MTVFQTQVIYDVGKNELPFFLQIFSANFPGSDDFVLLNRWDGKVLYLQMFYVVFQLS